jgi:hypothetical protein
MQHHEIAVESMMQLSVPLSCISGIVVPPPCVIVDARTRLDLSTSCCISGTIIHCLQSVWRHSAPLFVMKLLYELRVLKQWLPHHRYTDKKC